MSESEAKRIELPVLEPSKPPTWRQILFYRFVRGSLLTFARVFWRLKVEGKEHIPTTGSFVLCPVHRSNADFALSLAVATRRMRYMGKEGIWKYKVLWPVFDALGGFPVQRGTVDRQALRICLEVIDGGEPLVLFPEGARQSGPALQSMFDGAAYLAVKTGVPIIPVGIGGSEQAMPKGTTLPRPSKIVLVVGPPIEPERNVSGKASRKAIKDLTDRLRTDLQGLYDEAQIKAGA